MFEKRTRYLQNRWCKSLVILYVGFYLPGFGNCPVILIKMAGILTFPDLVNMNISWTAGRNDVILSASTYLADHEMKRFLSWFSDF